ncbi:MAG: hypothetical protein KIH06_06690, partial [Kiritimatiellae bacterium]|nr:hypothetical protein [Kiritimatiellia bacterium]
FWHRLNATRQIKCTSVHYVAFNLPAVAFTLSGDRFILKRQLRQLILTQRGRDVLRHCVKKKTALLPNVGLKIGKRIA